MDLEQIENVEQTVNYADVDAIEVAADVEELAELEHDVESSLNTVAGLIAMEETFTAIEVGDQESVTDRQLTAFRAGMYTTMIAANGNLKASFGIDTESTYVDATTEYAKDVEGIKEFFKKIWEKIKRGLIKANAFFRKMFLKFLNMVTFRKGVIEKLQDDIAASTTGNETLKASKFGIVKKYAAAAATSKTISGDKINITADTVVYSYGFGTTVLTEIVKGVKEASKIIKTGTSKGATPEDISAMEDALAKMGSESEDAKPTFEKLDAASMKKFKKAKIVLPVRASGSSLYVFGITPKGEILTGTLKIKADKIKTMEGLNSALLKEVLKMAETYNEDFKELTNTAFEAYDEAESIASAFEDVKLPDNASAEAKAGIKQVEKVGKNLSSKTPWIAFHTAMGNYKAIGYSIGLAKAYLKDVKDDKDDK